jgi:hypothetical protein
MQARDFVFWLQGYFEIKDPEHKGAFLTREQVDMIRKHLDLVFVHDIDPKMGDKEHQDKLNAIHQPLDIFSDKTLVRC